MWKFAAIFLLSAVFGTKDDLKGDVVLKIIPKTDAEVQFLKKLVDEGKFELDIWKEASHPNQNVDIHVKAEDVSKVESILKRNSIAFTVMISDVQDAIIKEAFSNQKNAFNYGFDYYKYNEYSKIKAELRNLEKMYPGRATHFSVGNSYEGEEMIGIQITACNSPGLKPVVWIDGGIHAREWISPATVMWFIRYLLTDKTPDTKKALEKYDFYILPVFNVDGYKYTFRGGRARMWRKTRKPYGWGCFGADPNRNWSYKFGGEGTSNNPCSDIYRGPRAFSEVEVDQVARYLKNIPNLKCYYNVHAYSQLVLTPWSYTSSLPPDYYEIKRVGDVFAKAIGSQAHYRVGPPSKFLYNAAGGSIDWTYKELGVRYSYAPELRDTGKYGFILPTRYIPVSGKETSKAFIAAALAMI